MPTLLLFAPCEKVILDADGLVSLITIIEKLQVVIPTGIQLAHNTAIPMRWQLIAMWIVDNDEMGLYEQMADVAIEDGSIAMHTEPKTLERTVGSTGVKIVSTLTAVPITNGPLQLRIFYRRIGEQSWIQASTYPVAVSLIRT
jgi:hypothetical protein